MNIDNQLIVIKTPKNNKYLAVIDLDKEGQLKSIKITFLNNEPGLGVSLDTLLLQSMCSNYNQEILER